MSEYFEMLVDVDATAEEAADVSCRVLDDFRTMGWITGEANPDCVPGRAGYRPGPAVPSLYRPGHHYEFWTLVFCGIEPRVGRAFNEWALGPVCEGFVCPSCATEFQPFEDAFQGGIGDAIGEWYYQSGPGLLKCPRCEEFRSITEWRCKPPLGFGQLSFRFWNWPRFDSPYWKVDLIGVLHDITGHTIVRTYGHF